MRKLHQRVTEVGDHQEALVNESIKPLQTEIVKDRVIKEEVRDKVPKVATKAEDKVPKVAQDHHFQELRDHRLLPAQEEGIDLASLVLLEVDLQAWIGLLVPDQAVLRVQEVPVAEEVPDHFLQPVVEETQGVRVLSQSLRREDPKRHLKSWSQLKLRPICRHLHRCQRVK